MDNILESGQNPLISKNLGKILNRCSLFQFLTHSTNSTLQAHSFDYVSQLRSKSEMNWMITHSQAILPKPPPRYAGYAFKLPH